MKRTTNVPNSPKGAAWLREKRQAAGLTLRDAEEKLKQTDSPLTYSHLCRIERGARRIPLDKIDALCQVLGADRLELLAIALTEDMPHPDQIRLAKLILAQAGIELNVDISVSVKAAS